jgi:DNA-binding PadR family transcriptional regulator
MVEAPNIDSMFRIRLLLLLRDNDQGLSGYDLAKMIEDSTSKRPSSGKLYPFLNELEEKGFLTSKELERNKKVYQLTKTGNQLVDEIVERMKNLMDSRMSKMLDTCHTCGVKLYNPKIIEIDDQGIERKYCCIHCKEAMET